MAKSRKSKPQPVVVDDRIITADEVLSRVPLDRSTIWRMVQAGRFPPPIQISTARIGWRLSSVLAWIAEREADPVKPRTFFGRDKSTATDAA
jgi:prophage regulatory protein